jgi:hypothetical protein
MNMIPPQGELRQRVKSQRFTPEERAYFAWLGWQNDGECCLTGYPAFEIAHTGPKAMGLKSPLNTCLPIRCELHLLEERRRLTFWEQVGFPDHLQWAADLYECHKANGNPMDVLQDMHRQADRVIIADMLRNPNNF